MRKYTYERDDLANRLSDACIVGHTTPRSAKIWVRVAVEGDYTFVISKQRIKVDPAEIGDRSIEDYLAMKGIQSVALIRHEFTSLVDKTHVFEFSGLEADSLYHYAVVASPEVKINRRWRFGFEKAHCFRTDADHMHELSFGYFSCHDPFKKGTSGIDLWDDFYDILDEHDASFVIGGGDQMYIDATKEDIWKWVSKNKDQLWNEFEHNEAGLIAYFKTIYRYVYRKYWSFPELRKVFRSFSTYMIWDDHEIMDGWGSYTDDELSDKLDGLFEWENREQNLFIAYAMFKAAKEVYIEYQHSHNPDTNAGQFDYEFSKGDVGVYALDMRGHRKYTGLNDGTSVLGVSQFGRFKTWIETKVEDKKAIFIVSPVPVVHWNSTFVNALDIAAARDDFRDEWDHESNYKERDKILDLVFQYSRRSGKPVIFLSGDVHCAAAFRLARSGYNNSKAKVFQFTSSAITRPPAPKISSALMLKKGKLGHEKGDENVTSFEKLLFVTRHNFGLIKCKEKRDTFEVWGHLYSSENEENELIQSRVKLF